MAKQVACAGCGFPTRAQSGLHQWCVPRTSPTPTPATPPAPAPVTPVQPAPTVVAPPPPVQPAPPPPAPPMRPNFSWWWLMWLAGGIVLGLLLCFLYHNRCNLLCCSQFSSALSKREPVVIVKSDCCSKKAVKKSSVVVKVAKLPPAPKVVEERQLTPMDLVVNSRVVLGDGEVEIIDMGAAYKDAPIGSSAHDGNEIAKEWGKEAIRGLSIYGAAAQIGRGLSGRVVHRRPPHNPHGDGGHPVDPPDLGSGGGPQSGGHPVDPPDDPWDF